MSIKPKHPHITFKRSKKKLSPILMAAKNISTRMPSSTQVNEVTSKLALLSFVRIVTPLISELV